MDDLRSSNEKLTVASDKHTMSFEELNADFKELKGMLLGVSAKYSNMLKDSSILE